jgi:nucleotide-binding universal stress UspA family protein
MPASTSKTPRIVVGVDGSPPSVAALRWAIKQAELSGTAVEAITAWQIPAAMTGYGWAPIAIAGCSDMELIAKHALEEAIAEAAGPGGSPLVRGEIAPSGRSC